MKDFVIRSFLYEINPHGSWTAVLTDGTVIQEGKDNIWWNDICTSIDNISFLGLQLPKGERYEFGREALAMPGEAGSPTAIWMRSIIGDSSVTIRFDKRERVH